MNHNLLSIVTLLFTIFVISASSLQAQDAIPATGGEAKGSGGTVSYSVGQMGYTTNAGSNGSVAQGVQQSIEISVTTEIKEAKGISLQCSVYPNPTTDYLNLKLGSYDFTHLSYQLIDMSGQILAKESVSSETTKIVLSSYPMATYFVRVYDNEKEVKVFKISKMN